MAIRHHPSLHHGAKHARNAAASIQHMFHKQAGSMPPSASGLGSMPGGGPEPDGDELGGGAPSMMGPPPPPGGGGGPVGGGGLGGM